MRPTKVFFENLQAYKDGCRVIINKGSARSSKTVSIIQILDFIANNSARHRKLSIISQSYPHLRDGAIYEYKKHLLRENITRGYNKTDHEFFVNQSIINYFESDPVKAIGPGRDIAYFNEMNKGLTFQTYNDIKTRTTECIWGDYNPSAPFFLHDEENKILGDERTRLIHSTWLDNLDNLTPAQIQDMIDAKKKSKTSDFWNYWWKVYGLGEDCLLMEERIMPLIKRASKVPKDAREIPSTLDFGFFPDPTSFNRLWLRKGELRDELYIKQVVYETKLSINTKSPGQTNLVDLLTAKGIKKENYIIAESAQPGSVAEMRAAGYNIERVVKSSIENSIRLFHDYDIFIIDGSEDVWKEFEAYRYARDSKGRITGIPEKKQKDHAIDGTRYVLMSRGSRWE